ncbi:MAG: DUF4339 domain-containing protein [Planctomycetota bacterium]
MATEWYYQIMNETVGPLSSSQLIARVRSGQVKEDTLIRKNDSQWVPAHQVDGLMDRAMNNQAQRICPYCGHEVDAPPTTCAHCNRKLALSFNSRLTSVGKEKPGKVSRTARDREAEQKAIWQRDERGDIKRYVFLLVLWLGVIVAAPYLIYLASMGRLFFAGDLTAISVGGVVLLVGGVYYFMSRVM